MGHAARQHKARLCRVCKKVVFGNAALAQEHAQRCQRAAQVGLVLAEGTVPQPRNLILTDGDTDA